MIRSDEEAAKEYSRAVCSGDAESRIGFGPYGSAFLAGCARYRPIVEEMLALIEQLKEVVKHECTDYVQEKLVARAEKLLGKKDE